MSEDRHNTYKISQWVAYLVSGFFLLIAVFGYQRTGDIFQLLTFAGLAVLGFVIVKLLFKGINYLLDSLDKSAGGNQ